MVNPLSVLNGEDKVMAQCLKEIWSAGSFWVIPTERKARILAGKLGLEVTSLWNRVMFWASS